MRNGGIKEAYIGPFMTVNCGTKKKFIPSALSIFTAHIYINGIIGNWKIRRRSQTLKGSQGRGVWGLSIMHEIWFLANIAMGLVYPSLSM